MRQGFTGAEDFANAPGHVSSEESGYCHGFKAIIVYIAKEVATAGVSDACENAMLVRR